MIVTEEEAKTKWCPWTRVPIETETLEWVVGNRANQTGPGGLYKGSKCIASQCMAWRWAENRIPGAGQNCPDCGGRGGRLGAPIGSDADCKTCRGTGRLMVQKQIVGYCGLAGTP